MESFRDQNYPGTMVLINKLGIQDPDKLAEAEAVFTTQRVQTLKVLNRELFEPAVFAKIHRHLFQDLYTWAGEQRTVDIGKPGGGGFSPVKHLGVRMPETSRRFEFAVPMAQLYRIRDRAMVQPEAAIEILAGKLARPVGDLNYAHPFRDGNGRMTRAYIDQLAQRAGLAFRSSRLDPEAWLEASIRSSREERDTEPLRKQLQQALVSPERERALNQRAAAAQVKGVRRDREQDRGNDRER